MTSSSVDRCVFSRINLCEYFIFIMIILTNIIGWLATGIGIVSFMPQVYKIYQTNHTQSLSLGMYILISISFVLWIIYGMKIGAMPIVFGNILMLVMASYILTKKILNLKKDGYSFE